MSQYNGGMHMLFILMLAAYGINEFSYSFFCRNIFCSKFVYNLYFFTLKTSWLMELMHVTSLNRCSRFVRLYAVLFFHLRREDFVILY